ncbi:biopolymer transporter ExbD [Candidatus Nomurabacteria bacterium]|nr:biopolymer transporter ExbD [Candidatus Nomurabacteria bacterium]
MATDLNASDEELISNINVTPLVDVVLVLLVIFLITAPVIYQSAIKVQLPKAMSGEAGLKSPLQFIITQNGDIFCGSEKMDWSFLGKRLAEQKNLYTNQTAMISADEKTPHGLVIKLMDLLRQSGLSRFALSVEQGVKSE